MLSLAAVLHYTAYRFLTSTMFTFYYTNTYKIITMVLLLVFGGVRYLYKITKKLKSNIDQKKKINLLFRCAIAWILALPFFYVGWIHDYKFLIFLPICCMSLYNMQAKKVFKSFFVVIGILLVSTVLCSLSGSVRNLVKAGDDGRTVAAYGIINTTDFASYFLFLLLTIWCGIKELDKSNTILFLIATLLLSYIAYILTDSRTVLYLGILLLMLSLWDYIANVSQKKSIQRIEQGVYGLSIAAFPLIELILLFLIYSYAKQAPWAIQLNQVLTSRLKVTYEPYETYGIHFFGNTIEKLHGVGGTLLSSGWSSGYGYLDIAYAMLTIRYGWAIAIVVTGLWVWMTFRAIKSGNGRIALAMLIMAVHGFSEARILDVNYNIFLIMPFCCFKYNSKISTKEISRWFSVLSGAVLLGGTYLILPRLLSGLRILFAYRGWNVGTKAINSLYVCLVIVVMSILFWIITTRLLQARNKKTLSAFICIVFLISALTLLVKGQINEILGQERDRLSEEKSIIRSVQEVATQEIYAAEQEELYNRELGGFTEHIFSTDEMRKSGSIFTDANIEALGIVSAGGMYTAISKKSGLYTFDSAVINKLSEEGFEWTPYYSGRRFCNLQDLALFNGILMKGESLELTGPCRIVTTNMETDQFSGTYEVEFKMSGFDGNIKESVATLEVIGEAGDRLIKSEEILTSDFIEGECEKIIKYSIGGTPKVSYAITVKKGAKLTIKEIGWKCLSQSASTGVQIKHDNKIIMTTQDKNNRFNFIHFQLFDITGQYLLSFGTGESAGIVSGDYIHNLASGFYNILLRGNTNIADEWVKIRMFIKEGDILHYNYTIEELTSSQIVINNVMINDSSIISFLK